MRTIPILLIAFSTAGALGGSVVIAQTTPASTGSTLTTDPLAAERLTRATQLEKLLPSLASRDAQTQKTFAAYLEKRTAHRLSCRQDLREANRDTKLSVLLRCERGELTLEREWLQHERDELQALTETTEARRADVLQTLDALSSAINTIVTAIDSNVYQTTDALAASRLKLAQKYRTPFAAALLRLRADRMLSWTALLLQDSATDGTGDSPTAQCLLTEDQAIRSMLAATSATGGVLDAHLRLLGQCMTSSTQTSSEVKTQQ